MSVWMFEIRRVGANWVSITSSPQKASHLMGQSGCSPGKAKKVPMVKAKRLARCHLQGPWNRASLAVVARPLNPAACVAAPCYHMLPDYRPGYRRCQDRRKGLPRLLLYLSTVRVQVCSAHRAGTAPSSGRSGLPTVQAAPETGAASANSGQKHHHPRTSEDPFLWMLPASPQVPMREGTRVRQGTGGGHAEG